MKSLLIVLVAMPLALLADVTTTPQWTPDPLCTYPSDELVFYIDPYDCTKYYQCHQGNKNVMSCPVGLYWNQERNWCDLPENVDCSRTISSTAIPNETTTPQWTPDPLCTYPSDELVFYIDPYDCTKYYQCHQGNKNVMSCPVGLYWNQERNWCDLPENVDCSRTISSTAIPSDTTTPQWTPDPLCTYPSDELVFYIDPYDCTKFYQCHQGNKNVMSCPVGLYWNQERNWCDLPENVDCSRTISSTAIPTTTNRPTTSGGSTTEGHWTPDPLCPYPSNEIVYFDNPYNCSQYYECYEGNKFLMNCPATLYWNEKISSCDYASNVHCTPIGPTVAPQTTASASVCASHADGNFVENPNDCSKYYECVGNKAIEFTCPETTLWNQKITSCDFSGNVDC